MSRLNICICMTLTLLGCATIHPSAKPGWIEFLQAPERFAGQRIEMCGWLEAKNELCELTRYPAQLGTSGAIWLFPYGDWCTLDQGLLHPFEGWAIVKGYPHSGANYGHFGAWTYAMDRVWIHPTRKRCDENLEPDS
jgi:hypothetical protein